LIRRRPGRRAVVTGSFASQAGPSARRDSVADQGGTTGPNDLPSSPTPEERGSEAMSARVVREVLGTVTEADVLALSAPIGIFRSTPNDGVVWVNHRFVELTGLSLDEARGRGWLKIVHPEDL